MAPLFSYRTFSSAVNGEVIILSPVLTLVTWFHSNVEYRALNEGAEAGDRFADDQVLHLVSALVGIESFRIHEETPDVVIGGDAVAAQQLTGPGDGLAALGRGERL